MSGPVPAGEAGAVARVPPEGTAADAVAAAALGCPVVAGLGDDGPATFLAGRRVAGVRLDDDVCQVSVVLRLDGRPLPELADEVRRAVAPHAGGRPVDVLVCDVVAAEEPAGGEPYPEDP